MTWVDGRPSITGISSWSSANNDGKSFVSLWMSRVRSHTYANAVRLSSSHITSFARYLGLDGCTVLVMSEH